MSEREAAIWSRRALEERETAWLAPWGMKARDSRGRQWPEEEHAYRTAYQRDRDRVIHTTAFRRLEYKTQVFVYSEGDHYRNRLTHSIEVAQIGRTLARALGSNEDLTEAICLAHDLGHAPFGHLGEETLNELMAEAGGYDHQRQTYRILTQLESRFAEFPGLNLTYEVLEGVVKHDTEYDVADAASFHPEERGTLECQLSNLADEIAYNTSDLDDGLRSGILVPAQIEKLAAGQMVIRSLGLAPGSDWSEPPVRHRFIRRLVGLEVDDVISTTATRLRDAGIESVADLRGLAVNLAGYSPAAAERNAELRHYLFREFYRNYRVVRMAVKAERVLRELFDAYISEPRQLPPELHARAADSDIGLPRIVCDYIAGMTDRYAIQEHKKLYDPEERA